MPGRVKKFDKTTNIQSEQVKAGVYPKGKYRFLVGNEIEKNIRRVLGGPFARCAVAYWGKGANKIFDNNVTNVNIICNLRSGGTNPDEIEKIMKKFPGAHSVRQCNNLHAKVYIGENEAVVTSANVSTNGLGLEGKKAIASLIEAGVLLTDITQIEIWFDCLWNDRNRSRPITKSDLVEAKKRWIPISAHARGHTSEVVNRSISENKEADDGIYEFLAGKNKDNVVATMRVRTEKGRKCTYILNGSRLYAREKGSYLIEQAVAEKHRIRRKDIIGDQKVIRVASKEYYLVRGDQMCESPHQAAVVVYGGAASWNERWTRRPDRKSRSG